MLVTLVDLAFRMGNAVQRYIRMEGRASSAKCGANSFHIGGPTTDTPCLAVGDSYSATTQLAVGSYTSPGTSALSVTGNATVSGTLAVASNTTITGTLASAGSTVTGNATVSGTFAVKGNTTITGTLASAGSTVSGDASITGKISAATMNVSSYVTMPGYMWAAGLVSSSGVKTTSTGQVSYTVARTSGYAAGVWTITFASAHPLGANYIVQAIAQGAMTCISPNTGAPTSTSFRMATYTVGSTVLLDAVFYFMVLAS